MLRERMEHMIEEAYACPDPDLLGFGRLARVRLLRLRGNGVAGALGGLRRLVVGEVGRVRE